MPSLQTRRYEFRPVPPPNRFSFNLVVQYAAEFVLHVIQFGNVAALLAAALAAGRAAEAARVIQLYNRVHGIPVPESSAGEVGVAGLAAQLEAFGAAVGNAAIVQQLSLALLSS
jgi:hypothetical protein